MLKQYPHEETMLIDDGTQMCLHLSQSWSETSDALLLDHITPDLALTCP